MACLRGKHLPSTPPSAQRARRLATVLEEAERALRMEVALARGLDVSWSEIGASLGVTRQAAQQRFSLAPTSR